MPKKAVLPRTHLIRYATKTQDNWLVLPEIVLFKDSLTLDIGYPSSLGSSFVTEIQARARRIGLERICWNKTKIRQFYYCSSLYICHTKAMTTLVEYGTRCLFEDTNFYSVLIVLSASWLKRKSFHFWKCCEEMFYLCVSLTQNHMEIFSTTAKLFVWRLRLRVQKAQSPHYWNAGGKNLKSFTRYKYLGIVLDAELPDDRHSETSAISILCSKQAAGLPDVQMQLKMLKCTPFLCGNVFPHLFSLVMLLEDLDFSFQFLRVAPGAS